MAAVRKPVSTDDHIVYILNGLGSDFEAMVSVISVKSGPRTVQDVMALLLTQENRNYTKMKSINSDGTPPSVHELTQHSHPGKENDTRRTSLLST